MRQVTVAVVANASANSGRLPVNTWKLSEPCDRGCRLVVTDAEIVVNTGPQASALIACGRPYR